MNRYADLESLIFNGFIPYKFNIGGLNLVFKSINDVEYNLIQLKSGISKGSKDQHYILKYHLNYLYYSLFLVNGENILRDKEKHFQEISTILSSYPSYIIRKFFEALDIIAKRVETATKLTEAYSYEEISRYKWLSLKDTNLNNPIITGISGTDLLGLNQIQKYWTILNIREDQKESFETNYSLFKFLASFQSSKDVKKIEAMDKARKEEEQKRRLKVIKGIKDDDASGMVWNPADTPEGIDEEYKKMMRGEKDSHDQVVEKYEKKLKEDMFKQIKDLQAMREKRKKQKDFANQFVEEARVISREEMLERISRAKERSKHLYYFDDDKSRFYNMSNVKDDDVIEEVGLSKEHYNDAIREGIYKKDGEQSEDDLSFKYGIDKNFNVTEEKEFVRSQVTKESFKEDITPKGKIDKDLAFKHGLDEDFSLENEREQLDKYNYDKSKLAFSGEKVDLNFPNLKE